MNKLRNRVHCSSRRQAGCWCETNRHCVCCCCCSSFFVLTWLLMTKKLYQQLKGSASQCEGKQIAPPAAHDMMLLLWMLFLWGSDLLTGLVISRKDTNSISFTRWTSHCLERNFKPEDTCNQASMCMGYGMCIFSWWSCSCLWWPRQRLLYLQPELYCRQRWQSALVLCTCWP